MFFWMVGLVWVLMCSGLQAQVTGRASLTMKDRVKMVVKGQKLDLRFDVTVSANQTSETGHCWDPEKKIIYFFSCPPTTDRQAVVTRDGSLILSKSGQYVCRYKDGEVWWVVYVKEEGVRESVPQINSTMVAVVGTATLALLVFSVLASFYVFKDHRCKVNTRGKRQARTSERRVETEEEEEKREEEEGSIIAVRAEASASVYASLEPRAKSIYEVIHPAATGDDKHQRIAKKRSTENEKSEEKKTQVVVDEELECVYENF